MAITAAMVKELREKTGAGMMDCKNALNENDGDIEAALDWLRVKGLAKAAKKGSRVASEGLVGIGGDGAVAAMVEVNSETDFVARNDQFQTLVSDIAGVAAATGGDVEALLAADYPGAGKSVADQVTSAIATIGENMAVRRAVCMEAGNGVVASYMHNAASAGLGKIGVLVHLEADGDKDKLSAIGKQVAMHIAATNPLALSDADVDAEMLERERAVFSQQAKESGKPDNIIEKMVEGRIRKYLEEIVLLKQSFVVDPDKTVEKAVKDAEGDVGASITVKAFSRFELGEGIEKEEGDFAAEVAAAAKGN